MKNYFSLFLATSLLIASGLVPAQAQAANGFRSRSANQLKTNPQYLKIDPASVQMEELTPAAETSQTWKLDLPTLPGASIDSTGSGLGSTNSGHATPGSEFNVILDSATGAASGFDPLAEISAWVDGIISIGKKIWPIIEAGKPVANIQTQRFSVAPEGVTKWTQMTNWQAPVIRSYKVSARNYFGMTVVSYTFQVSFNPGGQYQGRGQYLANLNIQPQNISVMWGFTLNSKVEIEDVVNTGDLENPIPGVTARVNWAMDSALTHLEGSNAFFARGNGELR